MARNVYNVDETLKQEFNFKHLKRLFGYLKPHRKKLLFALFLMIMASLANIIIPLLVKETIDHVIPEQDGEVDLDVRGFCGSHRHQCDLSEKANSDSEPTGTDDY